jgi:hypothetical protein
MADPNPVLVDLETIQGLGGGSARRPTQTLVYTGSAGALTSWTVPWPMTITRIWGSTATFISRTGRTTNASGMNGAGGGYICECQSANSPIDIFEHCASGELIWFFNAASFVAMLVIELD